MESKASFEKNGYAKLPGCIGEVEKLRERISAIEAAEARFDGPWIYFEASADFKEKINSKLPGGSGFELHQDQQAGWSGYANLFVTAPFAIDPAQVSNGCLEVVPGLHKGGLFGPGQFYSSSKPNLSDHPRRATYVMHNRRRGRDHRGDYYLHSWSGILNIARRNDGSCLYRI